MKRPFNYLIFQPIYTTPFIFTIGHSLQQHNTMLPIQTYTQQPPPGYQPSFQITPQEPVQTNAE